MELKPFLTYAEQVAKLRDDHGLAVPDPDLALDCLKQVNYYHLRGYYIHWMDSQQERFLPGVSFEDIWSLHKSDRAMRALLREPLTSVELKARCAVAYTLGKKHGPPGYLDPANFLNPDWHAEFRRELQKQLEVSKELFIAHYRGRYNGQFPIWVAIEVMTMGMVSKLLGNMLGADQSGVANLLGVAAGKTAARFLHGAAHLRNVCAHHGRLYGRPFTVACRILAHDRRALRMLDRSFTANENSLFAVILALRSMLGPSDRQQLAAEIGDVFAGNPKYEPARVGFPKCWREVLDCQPAGSSKLANP